MSSTWYGYEMNEFEFDGKKAKIVFPSTPAKGNPWAMKTEYFAAFQNAEKALVDKGYHLVFIENTTRWCIDEDLDRRHRFTQYLISEYSLSSKCAIVGMSCGGMIGVKYAARYPGDVAVLYLDAPVMNLLSCPAGVGKAGNDMLAEFTEHTGVTVSKLLNYREHPIDMKDILLKNNIPIILVCGDADMVVPYEENGKILYDYYKSHNGAIELILKEGCDHHPHGLDDPEPIVNYIEAYMR